MERPRFVIEQVALAPKDPQAAKKLLRDMGAQEWAEDHVCAHGEVFGEYTANQADLSFNYDIIAGKELEVLHYTKGKNWLNERNVNTVSHLGMHCSCEDLSYWKGFFRQRGIKIAQEVDTISHTNPVIKGKRQYSYVIFDTKSILGVDVKFIVRHIISE